MRLRALIFFCLLSTVHAATIWNCPTANYSDVNAVVNKGIVSGPVTGTVNGVSSSNLCPSNTCSGALDGDTVILPDNHTSPSIWASGITITKGITLQGSTTISNAGASNATANDLTIIQDNTPRSGAGQFILVVQLTSSTQKFRMTGITFAPSSTTTTPSTDGCFRLNAGAGATPIQTIRIDNCHFALLYQSKLLWPSGWNYGVVDHNFVELRGGQFCLYASEDTYGGKTQGNASWSDLPWFGTERFFFFETNTAIRPPVPHPSPSPTSTPVGALVDGIYGNKVAIRHNYVRNSHIANHGTEGGAIRGGRAMEVYDNTFDFTVNDSPGGLRSGSFLWHDNTYTTILPGNFNLPNYRETAARGFPIWGLADGTSPWDSNATTCSVALTPGHNCGGTLSFVNGQPPILFEHGTALSGSTTSSTGTMTASNQTASWVTNEWAGYSIRNTTTNLASYIISNTANSITYSYYSPGDGSHLIFSSGDTYDIHKVLVMMDQNGRGKTVAIDVDNVSGTAIPYIVGTSPHAPGWSNPTLEPDYQWNNLYTGTNVAVHFAPTDGGSPGQPTTKPGIDYFDLVNSGGLHGFMFSADTTPSDVSNRYNAGLNGQQYSGTFKYPHPCVTDWPTCTGTGSPTPTPTPTPCPNPNPPSGLTCTTPSTTVINLSWTDNSNNEDGFRIERSTDNVTFTEIAVVGKGVTTYQNQNLTPGTKYYYRVRSYLVCTTSAPVSPAFGHNKLNAITTTPNVTRELQDMWDDGGRVVRIDVDQANNQMGLGPMLTIARGIGFQLFVLICHANITQSPGVPSSASFAAEATALAAANPNCMIELSNEPNLHNISAATYASLAIAAYAAIKTDGTNKQPVLLGSVGNSPSTVGALSMYGWCAALVANGCTVGAGFDWANYHIYGNPAVDEIWWHIYTTSTGDPRTPNGQSCQIAFGSPSFTITEFGQACSLLSGTTGPGGTQETTQSNYIGGWMAQFKAQTKCKVANQFALGDEFNSGGVTGFGLRRLDLSHRPSWDAFLTGTTP